MQKYYDVVIDNRGNAILGATITVTDADTGSVSSIYSDDGITAKDNPFTASAVDGAYFFYAANGKYDIRIYKSGYEAESLTDIILFDIADGIPAGTPIEGGGGSINVYDVAGGAVGVPDVSIAITTVVAARSFVFSTNFAGSYGTVGTNPATGSIALAVKRNGTQFGTITISTSGTFTFATTSTPTFVAGDILTVVTPADLDSAADIYFTLNGSVV